MSLEHILLGMLEQPASGYQLKKDFDEGAKHFWSAELSQIYPTLQKMQRNGWLTSRAEPSDKGPSRRVYRRTKAGTNELKRWLTSEPILGTERYAYIGQLIFMGQLDDLSQTLRFVEALREQLIAHHRFLSAPWKDLNTRNRNAPQEIGGQEFHDWLCLGFGVASLKGKIAWCDTAITAIHQRLKQKPKTKESDHG